MAWSQETVIKGRFIDHKQQPISSVKIQILPLNNTVYSNKAGDFTLEISAITSSSLTLVISHVDFESLHIPVEMKEGIITIGEWRLSPVVEVIDELAVVDFDQNPSAFLEESSPRYGGQLRSRRTVFLEALSFQFSSAFFSARGLARKQQLLRINGIPMQNFDNGNASWSHWGGLNDITNRSQTVQYGLVPFGDYLGGVLGGVEIFIRPSSFRKGSKFSQAFSNRTYRFRSMFSTHTGRLKNGWALSALTSFRKGDRGYVEGTSYQAFSGFISAEKVWS